MHNIRDFIKAVNLQTRLHDEDNCVKDEERFRNIFLKGFDDILSLKENYKNKPALVMAHGPSLLNIKKDEYDLFLKITCNDFQKIIDGASKPFFDNKFKPDFWCGANSLEALQKPSQMCLNQGIKCLITIPKKTEFEEYLNITKEKRKYLFPWLWEHKIFQNMLAVKYETKEMYSHCNTVTNHMIALALWLGCAPIHIAGFDMSYIKARKKLGTSHAGYDDVDIQSEPFLGKERTQAIADLRYLCKIARRKNIKIYNLAYEINNLPYALTFKE